ISLIIIAVTALIGFIVYLATKTQFFQNAWRITWSFIKVAALATWNWLKDTWNGVWGFVTGVFSTWWNTFSGFWTGVWNGLKDAAQFVWDWISGGWKFVWDTVKTVFTTWWNVFSGFWSGVWNGLKDGASAVWDWITDEWDSLWSWVSDKWDTFSTLFSAGWNALWIGIRDFFTGIWDWIKEKWDGYWQGISILWERFKNSFKETWNKFWDWVRDLIGGILDKVKERMAEFVGNFTGVLSDLITKATEIWNKIKAVFATPINFVIDIWNNHIADKIGMGDKKISRIDGYADGGPIRGKGGSRADLVHAMVSPREYIVNAEATSRNRAVLDAINFGGARAQVDNGVPAFRDGGPVEWMVGWVKSRNPNMGVTSAYRSTNDHHGAGKAVDFGLPMGPAGIEGMRDLATDISSTWGSKTLELIYGNGFQGNIKDGRGVGDGMGFYGADTMAEHNNHVHWAVDRPLDEQDRGGIIGVITSAVNQARELVSSIFSRMTDPLINAIPNPFTPGMGDWGAIPKQFAGTVRDNILSLIKGKETTSVGGGDIGGVIPGGERMRIIEEALRITSTPPPDDKDSWLRGMNTLIERESGWNAGAVNNWDSNAAAGTPSGGLAQVIGPTFESHKAPGYDNLFDPVSNVAASVNYIKSRYGSIHAVQQANANMPPRGYKDGTKRAKPGLAWVAEEGPELLNDVLVGQNGPEVRQFKGGETVTPFDQTLQRIQNVKLGERSMEAVGSFFKANFDQFTQDVTGGGIESGALPQLLKQSMEYGQKLDAQGGVHFHVVDVDEALRKYKQMQREQTYGLM
ncbi:transglycosylase SLT domain-containing protein, partial [Nocardia grenadensis]